MAGSESVFRAVNGTPDMNARKTLELMGGPESFVGLHDIVVIKTNAQWWNHGSPNLCVLLTLVESIMGRDGGFDGEVILADNSHSGPEPWKTCGWAHDFGWNSNLQGVKNLNGLAEHLKLKYGSRFSACHWIDVAAGGPRTCHPEQGSGYVYCDGSGGVPLLSTDNGESGTRSRSVVMSYPIFRSDRGTVVDFRNGIWEHGGYSGRKLRFFNIAALNHHSGFCGVTSALKNYLGINDLSGGPDPRHGGRLCGDFCNFHSFAFDGSAPGPVAGMLGKEVAAFMKMIRKADLNMTTAEWVGLCSRSDRPLARTRAVLASRDPVALDFHAAKFLLYANSRLPIHDPENPHGPVGQYLRRCASEGGGFLSDSARSCVSYDFASGRMQNEKEMVVSGRKYWGTNHRMLGKYLLLWGSGLRRPAKINHACRGRP